MKLFKSSRLKAVNNILFLTDFKGRKMGFIQSWNLLSNFPVLEKVWKIEIKSGRKMVKSFFQSYNNCFISEFFLLLVKSYSISPICLQHIINNVLFLLFLRSLSHLFDNLESGKRNCCFGKSLDPKICANPVKRDLVTIFII